jgi:hypothetical protein
MKSFPEISRLPREQCDIVPHSEDFLYEMALDAPQKDVSHNSLRNPPLIDPFRRVGNDAHHTFRIEKIPLTDFPLKSEKRLSVGPPGNREEFLGQYHAGSQRIAPYVGGEAPKKTNLFFPYKRRINCGGS